MAGGIFHGGDYGVFSVVLGDLGYRIDVDDVEGGGCEGPFRCLHLCLAPLIPRWIEERNRQPGFSVRKAELAK